MAEEQGYGIVTTSDGTPYKVPAGLTQQQAFDYVAAVDPVRMGQSGHFSNLGDVFDLQTGVNNASLRWRLSVSSTMEEKANILNETAGPGNWGFTDWSNDPFVTPQGYENINNEPAPSDRLFLVDPAGTTSLAGFGADLVDLAPGAAIVTGAVVGELALPWMTGSGALAGGIIRNLLTRAVGAGAGDFGANSLLALNQYQIGDNRESLNEIISRIGTEAGLVASATLALGAPIAALAPVGGKMQRMAQQVGIGPASAQAAVSPRAARLGRITGAHQRVQARAGGEALPITIATLVGNADTGSLGFLAKMGAVAEGAGLKAAGGPDILAAQASKMILKVAKQYQNTGGITKKFIKENFTAKEQAALRQLGLAVEGKGSVAFKTGKLASLDKIDRTARALRTSVSSQLKSVYKTKQKELRPEFAKVKKQAKAAIIKDEEMAALINKISTGMVAADIGIGKGEARDILMALLDRGTVRLTTKLDNAKPRPRRGVGAIPTGTTKFTVDDILSMDNKLASRAYSNAGAGARNFQDARRNIKASQIIHQNLAKMKLPVELSGLKQLSKKYAEMIQPFHGTGRSRGLFKVFEDSSGRGNIEQMIRGIINGNESLELASFLTSLKKAFDMSDYKAAITGTPTVQEILGNMGEVLIREKAVEIGTLARAGTATAKDMRAAASKILKDLNSLEAEVAKKFGKAAPARKVWKDLFRNGILNKFKKDVAAIAGNNAAAGTKAAASLATIPTRQEVSQILASITKAADDPKALGDTFSLYTNLKTVDKEGAGFINDLYRSETFARLISLAKNSDYHELARWSKNWDEALANPATDDMLKEMLGKAAYDDYTDLALNLSGGLNVEQNAGSIVLGAMPLVMMGNMLQGKFKNLAKPALLMMTLKNFSPGSPLWNKIQPALLAARTPQATQTQLQAVTSKAGKAFNSAVITGQKLSNGIANGQGGYVAAGIHSFLEQNHYQNSFQPPRQVPVQPPMPMPEDEEQVAAPTVAPPPAPAPAPIAPPVAPPPAPAAVQGLGQTGLDIGAGIARGGI